MNVDEALEDLQDISLYIQEETPSPSCILWRVESLRQKLEALKEEDMNDPC